MKPNRRLTTARMMKSLTPRELAKAVGVTPEYIGMLEAGVRTPRIRVAFRIARALNSTVDFLFDPDATDGPASFSSSEYTRQQG